MVVSIEVAAMVSSACRANMCGTLESTARCHRLCPVIWKLNARPPEARPSSPPTALHMHERGWGAFGVHLVHDHLHHHEDRGKGAEGGSPQLDKRIRIGFPLFRSTQTLRCTRRGSVSGP